MFERFTEKARRIIFFARYEASQFGSPYIETEHLLLGVLREDKGLVERVHLNSEAVRKEVESRSIAREKISVSVDLPLSHDSKRALGYAAGEATAMEQKFIDTGHVLLGLMREEATKAAILLREQGLKIEDVRELVREFVRPSPPAGATAKPARVPGGISFTPRASLEWPIQAPSLRAPILRLLELVEGTVKHADLSLTYGDQRLKRKPWSRKEALGHLVDCATSHHQWIVRALTESRLTAHTHPKEEWVSAQQYETFHWSTLVGLWDSLNRLLIHALCAIPEEKVNTPCRIGIDEPLPLGTLIERYVSYTEDLIGQILAHL